MITFFFIMLMDIMKPADVDIYLIFVQRSKSLTCDCELRYAAYKLCSSFATFGNLRDTNNCC